MGWRSDAKRNAANWTQANSDYTDENAETNWALDEISWGIWAIDESELNVLGDVAGLDVVELGCGTAYFSAWLARRGARPVGVDITPAQLETALRMMELTGIEFPLVEADAGATGLPDESFDLVLSEYGASIWVDPFRWIPEAARLLRPGGRAVFLCNSPLVIACSEDEGAATTTLQRPMFGSHRYEWAGEVGVEFHLRHGQWVDVLSGERLRRRAADRASGSARCGDARLLHLRDRRVGAAVAVRGHLGRAQAVVSTPPPLVLASTSPQRRAILAQLGVPFEVVAPDYDEAPGGDPLEHAAGKARSVPVDERPVLGVDTVVVIDGRQLGKPVDAGDAERMLETLSGGTHEVRSGLCLRSLAWEELHLETTRVTFRSLTPRDLAAYMESGEWEGRAGAYAIQGVGASLVERIEGDYLNVVGLPAALLVRLLAARFPGLYGFG